MATMKINRLTLLLRPKAGAKNISNSGKMQPMSIHIRRLFFMSDVIFWQQTDFSIEVN